MRTQRTKKKKRRKWKIAGFSLLGIFILACAAMGIEYYQLQPKNHFKSIPVVSSHNAGSTQTTAETNTNSNTDQAKEPVFNVLLMGSDQRKGEKIGHSDSMMLIHVDFNKNKYSAVSIPRDTRVFLNGYGYTKLTSVQYIIQATQGTTQGIEAAVSAVSDLTGAPINYYVETNYSGFQSIVDAVGGINMEVPFRVILTHPWYSENKNKIIAPGVHAFDGKMVTEVVHERDSLPNGEFSRQRLQELALKGIAKKALSPANLPNLPTLIKSIPDFIIGTNMSTSDMLSLGLAAKNFNPDTQLAYQQLPGEGKTMHDDILRANNYEFVVDDQKVKSIIAADFQN